MCVLVFVLVGDLLGFELVVPFTKFLGIFSVYLLFGSFFLFIPFLLHVCDVDVVMLVDGVSLCLLLTVVISWCCFCYLSQDSLKQ